MKKIKIELDHATMVYNDATPEGKIAIQRLIGKNIFDPYVQACMKLGIEPKPELPADSDVDDIWADAAKRLAICIRADNMVDGVEWIKVYDGTERHYWPVADLSSGFGFSYTNYDYWITRTDVGSRFEYRTSEAAKAGFEKFNKYYKIVLTE